MSAPRTLHNLSSRHINTIIKLVKNALREIIEQIPDFRGMDDLTVLKLVFKIFNKTFSEIVDQRHSSIQELVQRMVERYLDEKGNEDVLVPSFEFIDSAISSFVIFSPSELFGDLRTRLTEKQHSEEPAILILRALSQLGPQKPNPSVHEIIQDAANLMLLIVGAFLILVKEFKTARPFHLPRLLRVPSVSPAAVAAEKPAELDTPPANQPQLRAGGLTFIRLDGTERVTPAANFDATYLNRPLVPPTGASRNKEAAVGGEDTLTQAAEYLRYCQNFEAVPRLSTSVDVSATASGLPSAADSPIGPSAPNATTQTAPAPPLALLNFNALGNLVPAPVFPGLLARTTSVADWSTMIAQLLTPIIPLPAPLTQAAPTNVPLVPPPAPPPAATLSQLELAMLFARNYFGASPPLPLSNTDKQLLMEEFEKSGGECSDERARELAELVGLTPAQIQNWFEHKRLKKRRETM